MKILISILLVINFCFAAFVTYVMSALTYGRFELWETILAFIAVFLWPITVPVFYFISSRQHIPPAPKPKKETDEW